MKAFKEVWREKYGKELSDEEADEYMSQLVGFFELLIEIDRDKKNQK